MERTPITGQSSRLGTADSPLEGKPRGMGPNVASHRSIGPPAEPQREYILESHSQPRACRQTRTGGAWRCSWRRRPHPKLVAREQALTKRRRRTGSNQYRLRITKRGLIAAGLVVGVIAGAAAYLVLADGGEADNRPALRQDPVVTDATGGRGAGGRSRLRTARPDGADRARRSRGVGTATNHTTSSMTAEHSRAPSSTMETSGR